MLSISRPKGKFFKTTIFFLLKCCFRSSLLTTRICPGINDTLTEVHQNPVLVSRFLTQLTLIKLWWNGNVLKVTIFMKFLSSSYKSIFLLYDITFESIEAAF